MSVTAPELRRFTQNLGARRALEATVCPVAFVERALDVKKRWSWFAEPLCGTGLQGDGRAQGQRQLSAEQHVQLLRLFRTKAAYCSRDPADNLQQGVLGPLMRAVDWRAVTRSPPLLLTLLDAPLHAESPVSKGELLAAAVRALEESGPDHRLTGVDEVDPACTPAAAVPAIVELTTLIPRYDH
jgi:hypothetical protein